MKNIRRTQDEIMMIQSLAEEFSHILETWVGTINLAKIVEVNKGYTDSKICASHDFCDSNMAMNEAFEETYGREFEDGDEGIWNEAWDLAKLNNFYTKVKVKFKPFKEPLYKVEFPGFDLGVVIPKDFEDISWHNDVCPSFYNKALKLRLWVHPVKVADREYECIKRFNLIFGEIDSDVAALECLVDTDNFQEINNMVALRVFAYNATLTSNPDNYPRPQDKFDFNKE